MAPESLPDPIAVALELTELLERLGIVYLVGGSLASSMHGEPRSTNDVDVVADFRHEHTDTLIEAIRPAYYVSREAIHEALSEGSSFNVIHMDSAVKVDVFIAGDDAFDAERLRRRQRVELSAEPPRHLFVDIAEHSVLRKLEWFRRGGETSERQWRDVLAILRVQGARLDRVRLELWAPRLGISDLLERALGEARQAP